MPDDAIEDLPEGMKHGPPQGWERLWWRPMNYGLAIVITVLFAIPLIWMFSTSLRPNLLPPATQIELIPPGFSFDNFLNVFKVVEMGRFLRNSIGVLIVAVPLTLLVASLAGFAMAQLSPNVRGILIAVSVAAMLVPPIALWLTRFLVYKWIGILDTPLVLIIPALMGTSPLFVLLFAWAFARVPREIYEQGRVDGASVWRIWWSLGLPLVRPIALGVALLATRFYWSDFINPLLYVNNSQFHTMPVGVQALEQMDRTNWPLLMAGSVILTLPVLLIFIVAQRYFFQEERQRGWIEH